MNPTKGQFVRLLVERGPWSRKVGCVLSVGKRESKVSMMSEGATSFVCIAVVPNDKMEDYVP